MTKKQGAYRGRLIEDVYNYGLIMKIKICYFASLREKLGRGDDTITTETSKLTVQQGWALATGESKLPTNVLIAINQEYVSSDTLLKDQDELAFFPPVTGG